MEEKERYIKIFENCIEDDVRHITYCADDRISICRLLNQQDKRIKELENMNSRLSQGIYWGNGEHFCDVVSKLKKENQQLKQQLHDLPNKIVEEIRNFCSLKEVQLVDWCGWISVEKNKIDNFLDTILKKYGGENDNG